MLTRRRTSIPGGSTHSHSPELISKRMTTQKDLIVCFGLGGSLQDMASVEGKYGPGQHFTEMFGWPPSFPPSHPPAITGQQMWRPPTYLSFAHWDGFQPKMAESASAVLLQVPLQQGVEQDYPPGLSSSSWLFRVDSNTSSNIQRAVFV